MQDTQGSSEIMINMGGEEARETLWTGDDRSLISWIVESENHLLLAILGALT